MQWKSPQLNEPFHLTMLVSPSIGPIKMTQTPVETQIIRIQYGNMLNHLWSVEGSCERGRYCWNRRRGLQSPVAIRRTFPHTRQHTLDFDFVIDLIYLKKEILFVCLLLNWTHTHSSPNKPKQLTQLDETQGRMWTFPPLPIHLIPSNPQTSWCLNYMSLMACPVPIIVDTLGRCFLTTLNNLHL